MNEYLYDRRLAFVKRYHMQPTLRTESVAEHQFFVARNAMAVCYELNHYGLAAPDTLKVIGMALIHDAAEVVTGDVPGDFKKNNPDVKSALTETEGIIYQQMFEKLPRAVRNSHITLAQDYQDKDLLESQIVKYADILDIAAFSLSEKDMGNGMIEGPWETAHLWLREAASEWSWLSELNKARTSQILGVAR